MRLKRLTYQNFMKTGQGVTVELPPSGLILVTGHNGQGKSTLVEAASYAGWGRTLRGTDPRREGEAGQVCLETAFGMQVDRSWKGKPPKVLLEVKHAQHDKEWAFENNQKAQEHVTEVIGEWDAWRRSCAFSSTDDLSFATATDSERKRLLESLLGLQRFDLALDRCRKDARKALDAANAAERALTRVTLAKEAAEKNLGALEQLAAAAAPNEDLAGMRARLATFEGMVDMHQKNVDREHAAVRENSRLIGEHAAQERRLQAELDQLRRSPQCPTCDQAWPDQEARDLKQVELLTAISKHQEVKPTAYDTAQMQQAQRSLEACRSGISTLKAQIQSAEQAAKRYQEAQELVKKARHEILDLEDALLVAEADVIGSRSAFRHLEVVDGVLDTRGARAHLLTDALTGLEAVANLWLDRVARTGAPLKLRLSPYTEKKTGGVSDAISLQVDGAGGGHGYHAASGGEKRRIDVALMLALAEVAQRSSGVQAPTTFFDEVFDALDGPGREAVAGVLGQLAQDRCVVVMSHSKELISHLEPNLVFHAEDGQLVIK